MLIREQFKTIADKMIEIYGVASYQNNLNEDPEDEINQELWFTCCECDEPILFEDFASQIEVEEDEDGEYFECPICGERIDL